MLRVAHVYLGQVDFKAISGNQDPEVKSYLFIDREKVSAELFREDRLTRYVVSCLLQCIPEISKSILISHFSFHVSNKLVNNHPSILQCI